MKASPLKILIAYNDPERTAAGSELDFISQEAVVGQAEAVYEAACALGHTVAYLPVRDLRHDLEQFHAFQPDMLFNFCEGYRGDAHKELAITGLWELLDVPYSGNSAFTVGLAQDKIMTKRLFTALDIPTPQFQICRAVPDATPLRFPVIAKPGAEDASVGITATSVVYNMGDLQKLVADLIQRYRQAILLEEFIEGREFNVSILGNHPPRILPVSEISFAALGDDSPHITSYEAKWLTDHPLYHQTPPICPAVIDQDRQERLRQVALQVYSLLNGRDYGRVDMRLDRQGQLYVLEYNPNPDISPDAGFVRSLKAAGIDYKEFIALLIDQTMGRKHD